MNGTSANLTLKQRRRMQGIDVSDKPERAKNGELSKKVSTGIFLVVFIGGIILGMLYFKPDPREIELANEEAITDLGGSDLSGDIRRDLFERMEDLNQQLPNRHSNGRFGGGFFTAFFAMAPADQLAALRARAEWDKRRDERMAKEQQDSGNSSQSNNSKDNNNNNNGNGGNGRGGGNDTQRQERMEQHLASRPPLQRGQMSLMHQMSQAVRQQSSR
jgi:hypothetical protein